MGLLAPLNDRTISYTPAAGTTALAYDFPILAAADLAVWRYRSGTLAKLTLNGDYSVTGAGAQNGGTVPLTPASLAGDLYTVSGAVPAERITEFAAGPLANGDLNSDLTRLAMLVQELRRDVDRSLLPRPTDGATGGAFDAKNRRIADLATPTGAADAVTKAYADLISVNGGTAQASWLQSGAGAVARTIDAKLRDCLSVKDFGAVGDGVANDTAALQAALTAGAGKMVYVPPGTYLTTDALNIFSGTWLCGAGWASVIKSISLVNGGAGYGHRQIDARSVSNFAITDLCFDASTMSSFAAGMRSISVSDCSLYQVRRCKFLTPGAAVGSINGSHYWVADNHIDCISGSGASAHDGIIDQWGGSNNFHILNNVVKGNGLGEYLILVTGTTTAGTAAACYDFEIAGNRLESADIVGIWINGRSGVNYGFRVHGNQIKGVSDYFGIAVADSYEFAVYGNTIRDTGYNGIRLYKEAANGGTASCVDGLVYGNTVKNANVLASANARDGAAIAVNDQSADCVIAHNRVKGSTHTYPIYLESGTARIEVDGSIYDAGTQTGALGGVFNSVTTNRIPSGGTYTPTLTAVANVSTSTPRASRWKRDGDVVTVTGRVEITPTAAASTATQLGLSLPIASGFTDASIDLAGVAATQFGVVGALSADITNDRAQIQFPAANTSSNIFYFTFQYTVKA